MDLLQKRKQVYYTKLVFARIRQQEYQSAFIHIMNIVNNNCSSKRIGDLLKIIQKTSPKG